MGHRYQRPRYDHEKFTDGKRYVIVYEPSGTELHHRGGGVWQLYQQPGQKLLGETEPTEKCPWEATWKDLKKPTISIPSFDTTPCPAEDDILTNDCAYMVYGIQPLNGQDNMIYLYLEADNDPLENAEIGDLINVCPKPGEELLTDRDKGIGKDVCVYGILSQPGYYICGLPCNDSNVGTTEFVYTIYANDNDNDNDVEEVIEIPNVVVSDPPDTPGGYHPSVHPVSNDDFTPTIRPPVSPDPIGISYTPSNDNDAEWIQYKPCPGEDELLPLWVFIPDSDNTFIQSSFSDEATAILFEKGIDVTKYAGIYYRTAVTSIDDPTDIAFSIASRVTLSEASHKDCVKPPDPTPTPRPTPTPELVIPAKESVDTILETGSLGLRLPADHSYFRYSSIPDSTSGCYSNDVNHTEVYKGPCYNDNDGNTYHLISMDPIADFFCYNDCATFMYGGCCPTTCVKSEENCRIQGLETWYLVQNDRDCIACCETWNDHCSCPEGYEWNGNDCECVGNDDDCFELSCPEGYTLGDNDMCYPDDC